MITASWNLISTDKKKSALEDVYCVEYHLKWLQIKRRSSEL